MLEGGRRRAASSVPRRQRRRLRAGLHSWLGRQPARPCAAASSSSADAAAADSAADDDDGDDDHTNDFESEAAAADDDDVECDPDERDGEPEDDSDGSAPSARREHRPDDIEAELDDEDQLDGADAPGGVMATYLEAVFSRLQSEVRGDAKRQQATWLLDMLRRARARQRSRQRSRRRGLSGRVRCRTHQPTTLPETGRRTRLPYEPLMGIGRQCHARVAFASVGAYGGLVALSTLRLATTLTMTGMLKMDRVLAGCVYVSVYAFARVAGSHACRRSHFARDG